MQKKHKTSNAIIVSRTALGIALVVVAQLIGKLIPPIAVIFGPFSVSQLITGTLVNCILIVFTIKAGILSGVFIGALSAMLASLVGIGPIVPAITPIIALGNIVFVVVFWLLYKKLSCNQFFSLLVGAGFKCATLWHLVPAVLGFVGGVAEKQTTVLSIMFSWPQGITALCGGLVAFIVLQPLNKATEKQ